MRHYQLFYITACVYNAPYIGSEGALNMSIFMFITAAVLYIWDTFKATSNIKD